MDESGSGLCAIGNLTGLFGMARMELAFQVGG